MISKSSRRTPQRQNTRVLLYLACAALLTLPGDSVLRAQQGSANGGERSSQSAIRSQSNVVLVRVVVRNSQGKPVTGLAQGDFKLFDGRKEQKISYFSAEVPGAANAAEAQPSSKAKGNAALSSPKTPELPQQFTALFFDDYHMEFGDLVQIREAARRYIRKHLDAGARVAIFSASGRPHVEFTGNAQEIEKGLSQLNFNRRFEPTECPKLSPYMAQLVVDDVPMTAVAASGSAGSGWSSSSAQPGSSGSTEELDLDKPLKLAEMMASQQHCPLSPMATDDDMHFLAENIVMRNDLGVRATLSALGELVQRMTITIGGTRTIAMVSDGFYTKRLQYRMDNLIDIALRANVVVSTLDARGLYAEPPGGDISEPALPPEIERKVDQIKHLGKAMDGDPLNEIAEGTGGVFVENTNDIEGGLAKVGALQTPAYVLGFSPENLKTNGRFHSLKVKIVTSGNFTIQARQGYFEPNAASPTPAAEHEHIEEAAFSQAELSDFPLQLSTKLAKLSQATSKLTVTVDADMRGAQFIRKDNRNVDDVTVLVVLFDQDGNYVTAGEQTVKLRLEDSSFEALRHSGGEATVDLTVKAGNYTVRAVLGDSDSNRLGAITRNLNVP